MKDSETFAQALNALPHGQEFRFLDRIISLEPGKQGRGEYWVRGDEPFLKGHFPGQPLFPGVLLVEAAAQLAGVVAQSDPGMNPLKQLKLTGMRAIKIYGTASPGSCIQLEAVISGRLSALVQASVQAWIDKALILSGDIILSGQV